VSDDVQMLQFRWQGVLELALAQANDGSVSNATAGEIAARYDLSGRRLRDLLKQAVETGDLTRRPGSGMPSTVFNNVNEQLHDIFDQYGGRLPMRVFLALVNEERESTGENKVSLNTVARVLRSPDWEKIRERIVPILSVENHIARLVYAHKFVNTGLNHVVRADGSIVVHACGDEKNFKAYRLGEVINLFLARTCARHPPP